jgi:hypothetical protein
MSDVPLPEPWDYCYEWDGPYGTRKFSTASHNGNRPDRSVPLYTADQMHAYAAAVSAQDNARLREQLALAESVRASQVAGLVEGAENLRERCAKMCDALVYAIDSGGNQYRREANAIQCAAAIRASNL